MRLTKALFAALILTTALASAARADDALPFFAGGAAPEPLKSVSQRERDAAAEKNPWAGFYGGTEVMAASGFGHGARGGFGGDAFLGYNTEFDNNVVLGVRASAGYMPGLTSWGPRGFGVGMAEAHLGYDMGRFEPYLVLGVGKATALAAPHSGAPGMDSINDIFSNGRSTTLTKVGAGFNYAVTDRLRIGVEASVVQAHGGFGPPMPPQPGQ